MRQDSPVNTPCWRRSVVGGISFVCLVSGIAMYFYGTGSTSGLQGILIRVGVVLAAIWLAMPQLRMLTSLHSVGAFLIFLALIIAAASRPSFFRIIALLLMIGLTLNWVLRWMAAGGKGKSYKIQKRENEK
jgi:hypothetical protein